MMIKPALRAQIYLIALTLLLFASATDGQEGMVLLALIPLCVIIYRRTANLFYVKNERIESRRGVISRDIRSIALADVRNINLKQGIVARLLNVGTLEFSSAASSGVEVVWWGVKNPMRIKQQIEKMSNSH